MYLDVKVTVWQRVSLDDITTKYGTLNYDS